MLYQSKNAPMKIPDDASTSAAEMRLSGVLATTVRAIQAVRMSWTVLDAVLLMILVRTSAVNLFS